MRSLFTGMVGVVIFSDQAFATNAQVAIPEPSILSLLAVGVAGLVVAVRFRNRK